MNSQRPTMRMVAAEAGVSTAIVSQVLNGRTDTASPATRERVFAAAKALGYRINRTARAMRTGRTGLALLSLTMLPDPWSQEAAQALTRRLAAEGVQALVLPDGNWREVLRQHDFDVAFIDAAEDAHQETLTQLVKEGNRLVVMGGKALQADGFDVVRSPGLDGCRAAMRHLVQMGHRRIHCLGGRVDGVYTPRVEAWREVLTEHGLPCGEQMLHPFGYDRNEAMAAALAALGRGQDGPTALFCTTDFAAIAAVQAARFLNLRVPDDISIIGAGNTAEGRGLKPALSSVGPENFMDRVADILMDRLYDRREPLVHTFGWELFVRESSAAPATRGPAR
ncbi:MULTISPECIES: LacI family DNA-binding transcriptional regulator [unclassified Luteococcus]|uniref:LacI family DNA-binding transcriptional regulator n=1 Tax=unclassified Luteococcus TaxID=2639923 RepID=UPI00313B4BE8